MGRRKRTTTQQRIGTTPTGTAVLVPKRRSKGPSVFKPAVAKPRLKHSSRGSSPNTSLVYRSGRIIKLPEFDTAGSLPTSLTESDQLPERPILDATDDNPFLDLNVDGMNDDYGDNDPLDMAINEGRHTWICQPQATKTRRRERSWPQWRVSILPKLVIPYLLAEKDMKGCQELPRLMYPTEVSGDPTFCPESQCLRQYRFHHVLCVDMTAMQTYAIPYCGGDHCMTIHEHLIRSGYFAASPCLPNTAFSIDVLESYLIPNRHTTYSVAPFRIGLVAALLRHGFQFRAKVPFRNQLPEAIIWFNALKHRARKEEGEMLEEAEAQMNRQDTSMPHHNVEETPLGPIWATPPCTPHIQDANINHAVTLGLADSHLRELCPACFGGRHWGRPAEINPDVQVAIDGNFTHRRYQSIADDPPIVERDQLKMWLTIEDINTAKRHMAKQSETRRDGTRQEARVPAGSLDECEKSHRAARDKGDESNSDLFASKGIMAMVCRHDVPLFLCDITTPGEQRYYSIALIQKLASMLPSQASIGCLYDIACLLDRSISKHDLIPDIAPRLSLATAAFHAYAHQFCCQIVYHPRKRVGFGMTNGEGNERLWALCKDTIGSERISGPHKRLLLLDDRIHCIAGLKRTRLIPWRERRVKDLEQTLKKQKEILATINYSTAELRGQWAIQQETQLSARAYSAQVASQNLASLIETQRSAESLTAALDALSKELDWQEFINTLGGNTDTSDLSSLYDAANELQRHHQESIERLRELTASLGLLHVNLPPNMSPEDREFVKKLIMIQAVKTTLWNKLQRIHDELNPIRESGSRAGPARALGTKRLQSAIKAVQGRGRAVLTTIDIYNTLVDEIGLLSRPAWMVAERMPQRLDRRASMRIDPDSPLWEDMALGNIWFTLWGHQAESAPVYVRDPAVRKGITAVLMCDRITEERLRLRQEQRNHRLELESQILTVCHAMSRELVDTDRYMLHRLRQRLETLLDERDLLKRLGQSSLLWRLPGYEIIKHVMAGRPVHDLQRDGAYHPARPPVVWDDNLRDPIDTLDDTEPQPTCGEAPIEVPPDEVDSEDEEQVSAAVGAAEEELYVIVPADTMDIPAFHLGVDDNVTGKSSRDVWRQNVSAPADLPPITILLDAIDRDKDPGMLSTENNPYTVWTIAASATREVVTERQPLQLYSRECGDLIVPSDHLRCLDRNRRLHYTVINAFIYCLNQYIETHPIARSLSTIQRPKIWVLPAGVFHLQPSALLALLLDPVTLQRKVLANEFEAWAVPIYSSCRKAWMLGVIDFRRRRLWYIDSSPLQHVNLNKQGDAWVWTVLSRIYYIIFTFLGEVACPSGWKHCTASHSMRQTTLSDSGVWMLADIEAWLMGDTSADPSIDIEKYRLRIRKHVLDLPAAGPPSGLPLPARVDAATQITAWAVQLLGTWPMHEFSRHIEEECETNIHVFV